MKWLLDNFAGFCKSCVLKAKNLWDYGFGYSMRNVKKLMVDLVVIVIWSAIFILYSTNTYVAILAIAIILCSFDRVFSLKGGTMFSSLVQPFFIITLYALASLIFFWAYELVLLFSILVLPIVTREIHENYVSYYDALTP